MKKIIASFLTLVIIFALCSCLPTECTVTFVTEGEENVSVSVMSGMSVKAPTAPTKEGCVFAGWFRDEAGTVPFDPEAGVAADLTVYAKYSVDYEDFSRRISEEASAAFLSVKTVHYAKSAVMPYAVSSAKGSGVIILSDSGYYYFLTNNHVISGEKNTVQEYTVTDVFGNVYPAELLYTDNSYDLALMRFAQGKSELSSLDIRSGVPDKDEAVAAIGNPLGKHNILTFGKIKNYKEVEVDSASSDESEVGFKVLWHTAFIESGSSGGALINTALELVGINFATGDDDSGEFAYGFAIPADEIKLFLGDSGYITFE